MNENQIPTVIDWVRDRLSTLRREHNVELKLEDREYRLEDDWLYLIVIPTSPGIRASDYAKYMSDIEKDLREHNFDNVLLMPAVDE